MKLQKASRFALYAVLELAADPARQLSAAEIAGRYGISTNHLAKVLRDLGRAGLVDSVRGVGGGYRFSGNAKRVTLYDVIEMFEDVSHKAERERDPAESTDIGAALRVVLNEIDDIASATLGSITLDTLLKLMRRYQRQAPTPRDTLRTGVAAAND